MIFTPNEQTKYKGGNKKAMLCSSKQSGDIFLLPTQGGIVYKIKQLYRPQVFLRTKSEDFPQTEREVSLRGQSDSVTSDAARQRWCILILDDFEIRTRDPDL